MSPEELNIALALLVFSGVAASFTTAERKEEWMVFVALLYWIGTFTLLCFIISFLNLPILLTIHSAKELAYRIGILSILFGTFVGLFGLCDFLTKYIKEFYLYYLYRKIAK
jgi:lysylphosphatidylglycerol synthetase-like protein (DUF2156 family)